MNRYKDIDILELEYPEDILGKFVSDYLSMSEDIAVIGSADLIGYILDNVILVDDITIQRVDFDGNGEFIICLYGDTGDLIVVPYSEFSDEDCLKRVYISMDGDVKQEIIDTYVNSDTDVILFGKEDEPNVSEKDRTSSELADFAVSIITLCGLFGK